ncbi:hypothetical protein QJS10_CPA09g00241 [Acorus calamus]|uniref:Uncharacterized protein n=1 Tax=Acorus calamus TaxID=4465 RepID=A0AAV9E6X6_ACOCL|nr:hypothetical protein QJS10_CPA09g00241 [Acorus calamus]
MVKPLSITLENVNTSNVKSVDAELRALEVVSSYLGPLAARNPDLLKPLKETLLALLRPDEDSLMKDIYPCRSLRPLSRKPMKGRPLSDPPRPKDRPMKNWSGIRPDWND